MEVTSESRCFEGRQLFVSHRSSSLGCDMNLAVYLPPRAASERCAVLYWLSGLTCTEQNFTTKAGAQAYAARHGLILVAPGTSPRGKEVHDVEDWDLGSGAGFYLDATQAPWAMNYRMHDYVVQEVPALIEEAFPASDRRGISGHSMGGHGALVLALRHPSRYCSVSAFAPIVAPSQCPWGRKAFTSYLGGQRAAWSEYDACELVAARGSRHRLLVDQGDADPFLEQQLRPRLLVRACEQAGVDLDLRMRAGYDHSYFFVATFIGEHIEHHARLLYS